VAATFFLLTEKLLLRHMVGAKDLSDIVSRYRLDRLIVPCCIILNSPDDDSLKPDTLTIA
jgi:hypothetical protein